MIMNMQVGMILAALIWPARPRPCRSEDYYDAATLGGADALRRADLGRLRARGARPTSPSST